MWEHSESTNSELAALSVIEQSIPRVPCQIPSHIFFVSAADYRAKSNKNTRP